MFKVMTNKHYENVCVNIVCKTCIADLMPNLTRDFKKMSPGHSLWNMETQWRYL